MIELRCSLPIAARYTRCIAATAVTLSSPLVLDGLDRLSVGLRGGRAGISI